MKQKRKPTPTPKRAKPEEPAQEPAPAVGSNGGTPAIEPEKPAPEPAQAKLKEELKPCPCGKIPGTLMIELPRGGKYGRALGDCCGEWSVEFNNHYAQKPEITAKKASKAWNDAPRGAV